MDILRTSTRVAAPDQPDFKYTRLPTQKWCPTLGVTWYFGSDVNTVLFFLPHLHVDAGESPDRLQLSNIGVLAKSGAQNRGISPMSGPS